jgi:hypothetical protein
MSIDTVFQPKYGTSLVGTSAVQIFPAGTGPLGMVSFRLCNTAATVNRIGWGTTSAGASAAAPTGATSTTIANSINIAIGGTVTLELPASIWLIASAASVEVTPGQGTASS